MFIPEKLEDVAIQLYQLAGDSPSDNSPEIELVLAIEKYLGHPVSGLTPRAADGAILSAEIEALCGTPRS